MSISRADIDAGLVDFSDVSTGELMPPITPGEILKEEFLAPMGISAYRLAKEISVPLTRITAIINGKRAITGDTAMRLGRYFGMSAEFWINLQSHYELDLARRELRHRLDREVRPLNAA